MKRIVLGLVAIASVALIAFGLAWARPDLVPVWAHIRNPSQIDDFDLYCKEHGVPEKFCTLCHAELKQKLLLCPEHGKIPDEICTLCHAENAKKSNIRMCPNGHGLPAHFCSKCHPPGYDSKDSASVNLINDGYRATFGPGAGPDGRPKVCMLLPLVRLASADLAGEIGIQTTPVAEVEHVHELTANAETAYDSNHHAEINPRVAGFLREARVDLGQSVRAGQVIAVVDSAEVSTAKTQYLSSQAAFRLDEDTYKRIKALTAANVVARKEAIAARTAMNQAQSNLWNAEQKLRNFRFDDTALARILETNDTRPLLEITTPIAGTVVFRHAVPGEAIEPTARLYTVVDTSKMWLWIDAYERDIVQVQPGQAVRFTVTGTGSASEETTHRGRITWVGTEVDHTTRTTKVRAELPNPDGKLRANQFGRAKIEVGDRHRAITLTKSAVQRYENVDLVFLPQKEGVYRPQRIKTRRFGRGDTIEVTWGLNPGQEVVTTGAFLLKTEIMKGSIGAGCCD